MRTAELVATREREHGRAAAGRAAAVLLGLAPGQQERRWRDRAAAAGWALLLQALAERPSQADLV